MRQRCHKFRARRDNKRRGSKIPALTNLPFGERIEVLCGESLQQAGWGNNGFIQPTSGSKLSEIVQCPCLLDRKFTALYTPQFAQYRAATHLLTHTMSNAADIRTCRT